MNSDRPQEEKRSSYKTDREVVIERLSGGDILTWKDLTSLGVAPGSIANMKRKGELVSVQRGAYELATDLRRSCSPLPPARSGVEEFLQVAVRSRKAVMCLGSAVDFYGMTTDLPTKLTIAIPWGSKAPAIPDLPLDVKVWRQMPCPNTEVIYETFKGVRVPITSKERTVVDVLRYKDDFRDDSMFDKCLGWLLQQPDCNRNLLIRSSLKCGLYDEVMEKVKFYDNANSSVYNSRM